MTRNCLNIGIDFTIPETKSTLEEFMFLHNLYDVKGSIIEYYRKKLNSLNYAYSIVTIKCENNHNKIFYKIKSLQIEEIKEITKIKCCWLCQSTTLMFYINHKLEDPKFFIVYKEEDIIDPDYKQAMDLKFKKNV